MRQFLKACWMVGALGLAACGDQNATSVVVAISSEVPTPDEVDELVIEVKSEENGFREVYALVPPDQVNGDPRRTALPGTLTLRPKEEAGSGPLTVTIQARLKDNPGQLRFVRTARMSFVETKQKLLRMPLRFACMDFPSVCGEGQTCKAGACVSEVVELEKEPDFEDTQVFSRAGACFDRTGCGVQAKTIPVLAAFETSSTDNCTLPVEAMIPMIPADKDEATRSEMGEAIRQGRFNFGFVWAANKAKKWTVVDQDPEEGWVFADAGRTQVRLSRGLCDVVKKRVVRKEDGAALFNSVIINTACEPKPALMPECSPAPPASGAPAAPAAP